MKRLAISHPFLFAAYAVLGVYTTNTNEIPVGQLFRPLVLALLIAAVLFAAAYRLFKDAHRAGFVTTLIIFWVFYFGHIDLFSSLFQAYRQIPAYRLVTVLIWAGLMLLLGSTWAWRHIASPQLVTNFLNVASLVVILFPTVIAVGIVAQTVRETRIVEAWKKRAAVPGLRATGPAPDIYYIMVDGYSRSDLLMANYGFDNSGLIRFLKQKGFYVADQSHSNYMQTELSLPSLLNFEYIDFLTEDMGNSNNRRPLIELIGHSQVRETVEQAGYTFVALPSAFLFTQIRDADVYLTYADSTITDFEALLLSKSVFGPLIETAHLDIPLVNYDTERRSILFTLDQLEQVPDLPGPKFVFAHILSPHHPFTFDANGNALETDRPYYMAGRPDYYGTPGEYAADLSGELTYIDRRLEQVITAILSKSERPPIIIVHGDHGIGATTNFVSLEENCLADRFAILNAFYFPDQDYSGLYPSITLVNDFRVVFNTYFGADLDILTDRNYYSSVTAPYQFVDVTGSIRQNACFPLVK